MALQSIEEWVPHRDKLVLLDEAIEVNAKNAIAKVEIREDSLFCENGKVPAWVGIEYMAQTMAVYSGGIAKESSSPVSIAFLLGARRYETKRSYFQLGEILMVHITPQMIHDQISSFNCEIKIDSEVVATAALTAFKPDEETLEKLKS